MLIQQYIEKVNTQYKTGFAREHSYRADLQNLLQHLAPEVLVTNEPARVACGAPDYIITKYDVPLGYIEAKDVGKALNSKDYKEQFDRYKKGLPNLIITDYLDFHLYKEGELTTTIAIGSIDNGRISSKSENFEEFSNLIKDFCVPAGQTIKSAARLSRLMAGKARMLAKVIENALNSDEESNANSTLKDQMLAFEQILIHDIKAREFADIYAQTIAYGMFAARLHDHTLATFSRQEAAELIPKTNPFLRKLFGYILGPDIDDRIRWIVDALADLFRATDVAAMLKNFGKATQQQDPIIHFYETFLAEYDPRLRKSRGVWYTPEPVVNFIVRAVDDILKTEFGLAQGLADTSKTTIEVDTQMEDKRSKTGYKREKREVHKVQILDPATGTGTFLAEVVKQIYQKFKGQEGIWSGYVEEHLIPRLNGFELLMASYAMAHLKLDMLLRETGYKPKKEQRLRVYLTNSLEEHHQDTGTIFASWLSNEASEANYIKRDTPVMVVLGNPPYSVSSSNKGEWIEKLTADYKKDLNERNIQPLSDDYIKFIRYGQHFIDKNGEGILAFITNNSFLDGIIHRQMRKHLLESFDKIYVLDLHGNAKKKEVAPDGSADQNVFDIMQGVSINLFVKTGKKKTSELAKVYHYDVYGKRDSKYDLLSKASLGSVSDNKGLQPSQGGPLVAIDKISISSIQWNTLKATAPNYFFVKKDIEGLQEYDKGFKVNNLFKVHSNGFTTERDAVTLHIDKLELQEILVDLENMDGSAFRNKYRLKPDGRDWKVKNAKDDILNNQKVIVKALYRPFDWRHTCYTGKTKGFYAFPRGEVLTNMLKPNYALIIPKQNLEYTASFITNAIAGHKSFSAYNKNNIFPLYLYPTTNGQQSIEETPVRTPNLNKEIVQQISEKLGLSFVPEKEGSGEVCYASSEEVSPVYRQSFAPIDLLDYIYAVLHSPGYREKYKEFLKIDFPRVPYPEDTETFWQLVKLGGELRQIHLLESPVVEQYISSYPEDGDNTVTRSIGRKDWELYDTEKQLGRLWINDSQYFDKIPLRAWEFYIGGYQPAQKWLKDRKGRVLSYEDILHYQKIIVALTETDRLMREINEVGIK